MVVMFFVSILVVNSETYVRVSEFTTEMIQAICTVKLFMEYSMDSLMGFLLKTIHFRFDSSKFS